MPETRYRKDLPTPRLEERMGHWKTPYNEHQAKVEANRCIFCHDAPCITACPTSIDIPEFIRRIATGQPAGAAKTILEANMLGLSCGIVCPVEVLCVGDCVYNAMGVPPIQIGKLQYFAVRHAFDQNLRFRTAGKPTGNKIACLGAGPASLAAAHELTAMGHEVVVFEKRRLPGGLNTTGVAPYKMRTDESLEEVEFLQSIGFEIRCDIEIGRDLSFADLEADYDAIFIGVGLGADSRLDIPGNDLPGVCGAIDWIERIKNEPATELDGIRSVVVVGGGNTALDVARETARLGIPDVSLIYRRDEEEITGYLHERTAARTEGVLFEYRTHPVAYLGQQRVEKVRLVRTEIGSPDSSGRRHPIPIPGSEFELSADLVVEAIGQGRLEDLLADVNGIEFDWGKVVVDPTTGRTGHPRIYAGGDCVNGGKEVVNAVEHGKVAARSIDAALAKGESR